MPARTIARASVAIAIRAEGHAHEVTLSDFEIDATEVTVERYVRCVASRRVLAAGLLRAATQRYDVPSFRSRTCAGRTRRATARGPAAAFRPRRSGSSRRAGASNHTFPWGNLYNPRLANHGSLRGR